MQFPQFKTTSRGALVVLLASLAVFVARTSALTTSTENALSTAASAGVAAETKKSKVQHFARVKSDGTLLSGTAISAERFNEGSYFVRFAEPIAECGAAANSAAFDGFDLSVFRIFAQLSIGYGVGGGVDDVSVGVSLFGSDGFNEDSSFTLVLSCP